MLIVGAGGFAKEVFELLHQENEPTDIVFFDDITENQPSKLYDKYTILRSLDEAEKHFNNDKNFTLGIGNPKIRETLSKKMIECGGKLCSTISPLSNIATHDVTIGEGNNILAGVHISNGVKTGIGCLLYYNVIITHDTEIGNFVEVSPGATLLGHSKIGDFTQIGAGAIVFPGVRIGANCIIGAGSVVREDLPSNTMAAGVPAEIKKKIFNL